MAHSCGDIVGGIEPRHDAVHVVRLPLGRANAEAWDLLDDGERRRAARLIWDDDRNRFVVAHAWLRVVLGQCIGLRPSQICFSVSDTGKPTLSQIHDCDLRFNMAHSGEYALVALSLGREVGVDIEKVRDVDAVGLATALLSDREVAALLRLAPTPRLRFFCRCWTRAEAIAKAAGYGIGSSWNSVSQRDAAVPIARGARSAQAAWGIRAVPAPRGYTAAVVAAGQDWCLRVHRPEIVRELHAC